MQAACVVIFAGLGLPVVARAQVATPGDAAKEYDRSVAGVQAELDAGRIAEARRKLEATGAPLRSFEYDYLLARAQAEKPNSAAPDLIRTISKPDVETRYGVLNEIGRKVVFICRDGTLHVADLSTPAA